LRQHQNRKADSILDRNEDLRPYSISFPDAFIAQRLLADPQNQALAPQTRAFQSTMSAAVKLYPRRKTVGYQSPSTGPLRLDIQSIKPYYGLPQKIAAAYLGISLTALKGVCRKLGIPHWRKLKAPSSACDFGALRKEARDSHRSEQHGASIQVFSKKFEGCFDDLPSSTPWDDPFDLNIETSIPSVTPELRYEAIPLGNAENHKSSYNSQESTCSPSPDPMEFESDDHRRAGVTTRKTPPAIQENAEEVPPSSPWLSSFSSKHAIQDSWWLSAQLCQDACNKHALQDEVVGFYDDCRYGDDLAYLVPRQQPCSPVCSTS
jgi:hypothetical protein